ncbi:MAG: HAD-IIB family hydrolase [Deltaproteobacteria bacterium]|nr:HAD-IIB family hydrolase [Deltaproteobacteria bacterium]
MRPLAALSKEEAARISVLFSDIDDTITTDGKLTAQAYDALWRLHDVGLTVVPVTGRPAGWCDHIARFWPVAGIIGENGAFYMRYDRVRRRMFEMHALSTEERALNRRRLELIRARIAREVPNAGIASDQPYRQYDLAVDFCEDVPRLSGAEIAQIVAIFEDAGATAKVSSIHVNGWFGHYDKLTMMKRFAHDVFGLDLDAPETQQRVAYMGDSPNDEPGFRFFRYSIAVANIAGFADALEHPPAFVTQAESGAGFTEAADWILSARSEESQ